MPGYRTATGVHYYEQDYTEVIKSLDPIAYWPMGERFGSTAYGAVNGFNGAITGATLGEPGIGDGLTSMLFDGANDFVNIGVAGLLALFDGALGSEGTVMIWAQVAIAGDWTDGATRSCFIVEESFGSNRISIVKANANNRLDWRYQAAGTTELVSRAETTTGWMHLAKTWSKSADELIAYFNGVQEGATQTGLGVWGDNVQAARMNIGATSTTPAEGWHGRLAHAVVFPRPLTPAEVQLAYRARPKAGSRRTYTSKVLSYNPTAYWPLDELTGSNAHDVTEHGHEGTYTGVTLDDAPGPDGRPTPLFDGANDFVNIFSAGLAAAFDSAEGSAAIWGKVFNVGVWTDSSWRHALNLETDGASWIYLARSDTDNRLQTFYTTSGAYQIGRHGGLSTTSWFHLAITWSVAADEVKHYYNGTLLETDTGLGTWAGALGNTTTTLGAHRTTPEAIWHGWLAHGAVWGRALSPTEIADLAVIP